MAEQWLDQMFEPCAVYRTVREDGRIVDFERVFLNAAGRAVLLDLGGDAQGTSMVTEAPNVVEQGLFARYVEVAETGIPWSGLSQPYSDDLRSIVLDIQAWRVPDGIAITYRDVTERERLAQQLQQSEQRLREIVDRLPDAVSVFESVREDGEIVDFRWVYANADNAAMTGYPVERLVGSRLLDVFPEQERAGMFDVYVEVVESGVDWREPTVWYEDVWGDGTCRRRAFDVRASKVGDGFVVVSRDVTQLARRSMTLMELAQEGSGLGQLSIS
jgi:PAS domain-containing protein